MEKKLLTPENTIPQMVDAWNNGTIGSAHGVEDCQYSYVGVKHNDEGLCCILGATVTDIQDEIHGTQSNSDSFGALMEKNVQTCSPALAEDLTTAQELHDQGCLDNNEGYGDRRTYNNKLVAHLKHMVDKYGIDCAAVKSFAQVRREIKAVQNNNK